MSFWWNFHHWLHLWCSQQWKFLQNDDVFISVYITSFVTNTTRNEHIDAYHWKIDVLPLCTFWHEQNWTSTEHIYGYDKKITIVCVYMPWSTRVTIDSVTRLAVYDMYHWGLLTLTRLDVTMLSSKPPPHRRLSWRQKRGKLKIISIVLCSPKIYVAFMHFILGRNFLEEVSNMSFSQKNAYLFYHAICSWKYILKPYIFSEEIS